MRRPADRFAWCRSLRPNGRRQTDPGDTQTQGAQQPLLDLDNQVAWGSALPALAALERTSIYQVDLDRLAALFIRHAERPLMRWAP